MQLNEIDLSLSQQLTSVFVHHSHPRLRGVHVNAKHDGEVLLQGRVTSYFEKQMAQETIRRHIGSQGLRNDLEVIQ